MESTESVVMQTWREYTDRLLRVQHTRVERLPGANRIYLSEATGCPRKATLRLAGAHMAPHSVQSTDNMNAGIRGQEKVALVLEANGWFVRREVPVQTKYGNGRIDLLVYPNDFSLTDRERRDKTRILEVKTTTMDALTHLPRQYHVDQALLYQGFYRPTPDEVYPTEVVYLLRDTRNTGDLNESGEKIAAYVVEWNEERFLYLEDILEQIDQNSRQNRIIGIPEGYARDKTPCVYPSTGKCVYYSHCWNTPLQDIPQNVQVGTAPGAMKLDKKNHDIEI